jgi:hypothetical protein
MVTSGDAASGVALEKALTAFESQASQRVDDWLLLHKNNIAGPTPNLSAANVINPG